MKLYKKIIGIAIATTLLALSSCSDNTSKNNDNSSNDIINNNDVTQNDSVDNEQPHFGNSAFKNVVAETLKINAEDLTYEDLAEIYGVDVYYYAERVSGTDEYKNVWSVTVMRNGYNDVFEAYYNAPKEERENLENPADYCYNEKFDSFDGYKDLKLLKNLKEISFNSEYMIIKFNPLQYIAELSDLESVSVYNYIVSNLDLIKNFKNLKKLSVGLNTRNLDENDDIEYISDLSPLEGLTKLETLSLSGNSVSEFSSLAKLPKLRELTCTYSALSDISSVEQLKNLSYVNFIYNGISDVTPLTKLPQLKTIYLDYNYIQDVSPFSELNPDVLEFLSLDMNSISDDTPLKFLGTEKVYLGYTPYWD